VVQIFILMLMTIFAISITWTGIVGAPWVPTSMKMVQKMLELAEVGPEDLVYDLGCGDGRTVFTAARVYGARAIGIEIDPLRYIWCRLMVILLGLGDRVKIIYGDFFRHDLSEATVVTCYLLQSTNNKLEEKLKKDLRFGARVVSNTFTFSSLNPVRSDGEAKLFTV
jgi:predicted RNA methylase